MLMKKIISTPFSVKKPFEDSLFGRKPLFFVFVATLILGIAAGAFAGRGADDELMKNLDILFLTNYRVRCTQGLADAFIASFASVFLFLLILFL